MKTENLYGEKSKCCGCWGCYNICPKSAITMEQDNEGFLYPSIDENVCIDCKMCLKVCPIKTAIERKNINDSKPHIGIINLQHTQNYGAAIAASVLETVVRRIVDDKYDVVTIDYQPKKVFANPIAQIKDSIKDVGGIKLYYKVHYAKKSGITPLTKEQRDERNRSFLIYKDRFLNLTETFNDAFKINEQVNYKAFITGSDIVWAPKKADNYRADGYFLKFANKGEKRIAYAPSIDCKQGKKLHKLEKVYKENLDTIDCVSVREKDSIAYLQRLTEKKVYECCDPAFLFNSSDYDEMINSSNVIRDDNPFIYVYILEYNPEIVEYANKLAKEKNLKICYFSRYHSDYIDGSEDCYTDGPAEFLYRLKNAKYVLTNSFHCVVFSLLFHKSFLSFNRSKISVKSSDLLMKMGLEDRLINSESAEVDVDKNIDFERIDSKLNEIRLDSLQYLTNALLDLL